MALYMALTRFIDFMRRADTRNGAQGRNRTGTVLLPRDFKSLASTNFATWASSRLFIYSLELQLLSTTTPSWHQKKHFGG